MTAFEIDMSQVDTSYWRDHPNVVRSGGLWPGYHCNLDKELRRDWGLNCGQYYALYDKQGGRCALCHRPSARRFDIDHDHYTGAIRGLLCKPCNRNLSQQIADYILNPPAAELNLKVNSKKVTKRDQRLKEKRTKTAQMRAKDRPQPIEVPIDSSASAEEKMRRALESSR
jgi:hypothetical protein